jgi:hypothetical protein
MAPTPERMNSLINTGDATTVRLQEDYKIPFSKYEVRFLNWFYSEVITDPRHNAMRLLEVAVFHSMCKRHSSKIHAGEDCKLKLQIAEVISLKRILIRTAYVSNWKVESDSVLFKLDQLTVGIQ